MKITYDDIRNLGLSLRLEEVRRLWKEAEAEAEAAEKLEEDFDNMDFSEDFIEAEGEVLDRLEDDIYNWRLDAQAARERAQEAYESLKKTIEALEDIVYIQGLAEKRRERG